MGFLDFFKKKPNQRENQNTNSFGEKLDKLTNEGELPFGWLAHNREFTDKINREFGYFMDNWLNSRNAPPIDHYAALKSFILYMEDVEKVCKAKGECFEFWFNEILISPGYMEKRKEELNHIAANIDNLLETHAKKENLKPEIERILKENAGILQSDLKKMFDAELQNEVSEILYSMSQSGEIERIKTGRTYKLYCKG